MDASLAFLRRNFRGRYLLTDAEVGVIGRDILNHLRLLLDGPAMSWKNIPEPAGDEFRRAHCVNYNGPLIAATAFMLSLPVEQNALATPGLVRVHRCHVTNFNSPC